MYSFFAKNKLIEIKPSLKLKKLQLQFINLHEII